MNQYLHNGTRAAPVRDRAGHDVPTGVRRAQLERAIEPVEEWLDAQNAGDSCGIVSDPDDLWRISALALAGAPEVELARAVDQARDTGWEWGPIAMLLGHSTREARARFDRAAPRRDDSTGQYSYARKTWVTLRQLIR